MTNAYRFLAALALLVLTIPPLAHAQNVFLDAPGLLPKKKAPPPPEPKPQPLAWPRLDPGAILCATEDDMDRHSANMTARVSGGFTGPADCRRIAQPTAVQILERHGPGRTKVQISGTSATGWTDIWLPDKAPPGR